MIHIKKSQADPLDILASQASFEQASANEANASLPGAELLPADMSNTKCLMMVIEILRETMCSFAKVSSPRQTMKNELMEPVADALGAVLDKYGISLSGVAGDFMTEIKAAIVTIPVLLSIRAGLQTEIREKKQKPTEKEPEPELE